jgi:hypothetical protein
MMPGRSAGGAEDKRRIITATDEGMSAGARQRDRRCGQTVGVSVPRAFAANRRGGALAHAVVLLGSWLCALLRYCIFLFFPYFSYFSLLSRTHHCLSHQHTLGS